MKNHIARTGNTRGVASICCILIGCMLIAGCIHSGYPDSYPARVVKPGDECPDLQGQYLNPPDSGFDGRQGGLFDDITDEGRLFGLHQCLDCTVELKWLDNEHEALEIRLLESDSSDHHLEARILHRSRNDFSCSAGGLRVPFRETQEAIAGGNVTWGFRTYWLADDGSLVRQQDMRELGHDFVVVPYYMSLDTYARWPKRP